MRPGPSTEQELSLPGDGTATGFLGLALALLKLPAVPVMTMAIGGDDDSPTSFNPIV